MSCRLSKERRMKQTNLLKIEKWFLFFLPGLLGLLGLFAVAGETFANSLFSCVTMYVLNYTSSPPNILVELARWTAPLSTASGILLAVSAVRERVRNYLRYRSGKGVAVYGPKEDKAELLKQLGKYGIDGEKGFVRAQRYILLDDESQNFRFYNLHREALQGASVYIKCRSIQAQCVSPASLNLFCPEETAARLFWKRRPLFELSRRHGHRMQIVFLGFGKLGEELLTYALQDNIFSPDQRFEYHIFGNGVRFTAMHTQLSSISDTIVFHSEPWYESIPLLEQAQTVIVLTQEEQLLLLHELLLTTSCRMIDVFAVDEGTLGLLDEQDRLALFAWKRESLELGHIFSDALILLAKQINLHYANLYGGASESSRDLETEWQKLDAFTRYSNISAADYHEIRLKMLAAIGQPVDIAHISPDTLELLAELEHIRWSRYHYLNNWRYGIPEDGRRKDKGMRIHADLLPYRELSDSEREKDRKSVRQMLKVAIKSSV